MAANACDSPAPAARTSAPLPNGSQANSTQSLRTSTKCSVDRERGQVLKSPTNGALPAVRIAPILWNSKLGVWAPLEGVMLTAVIYFVQFVIFLVHWLFMLAGIFHVVRRYCYQFRIFDSQLATLVGYIIASSLFFELLLLFHEFHEEAVNAGCSTFRNLAAHFLPGLGCKTTFNWSVLWRLNFITVVSRFLSDLLIFVASTLGSSAGSFVSGFFDKLSWVTFFPAVFLCSFVVAFSVMAINRYEISLFGFLSLRPSSIPIQKPSPSPPPPYQRYEGPRSEAKPVRVIRELYQRLSP